MKLLLASSAALVALVSGTAHAGEVTGVIEVGAAITTYNQSDDSAKGTPAGVYVNASANVPLTAALDLNITAKGEFLDGNGSDFDTTAPGQVGIVGAALNYKVGAATVGAFGAVGKTDSFDNRLGYVVGGQAAFDLGTFKPFAQVGYADVRVDGTDSGFSGLITRGGVEFAASDALAFTLDGGYGHANKDFEDVGDAGTYWNLGGKVAYRLTKAIVATASYEYRDFQANTEDRGYEHAFRLGIAIPLGGSQTARDTFNNLSAQTLPFRAASYGEVLD